MTLISISSQNCARAVSYLMRLREEVASRRKMQWMLWRHCWRL